MRISHSGVGILVQTPAKINLSLNVLGKREDGFHDLETLMYSVRLYDTLRFAPRETNEIQLTTDCLSSIQQQVPTDENNLIVKAANLLRKSTGCDTGTSIHLIKRIPSEAGLGGGSSDAAATLVCLNQLWKLNLSNSEIHEYAAQLGSDVNFFIDSHLAAVCIGRGEKITSAPVSRPLSLVLVKPVEGLSTGNVFKNWQQEEVSQQQASSPIDRIFDGSLQKLAEGVSNSLEQPARKLSTEVDLALTLLKRQNVIAAGMSGSGTACFGVCRTWRHAQVVAAKVRAQSQLQTWALRTGV